MPTPSRPPWSRPAARSPSSTPAYRPRTSQRRVPEVRTGRLGNRCASASSSRPGPTRAAMTRPLDAPRSTAARVSSSLMARLRLAPLLARSSLRCSLARRPSAEEGRSDAGIDGDVQAGGAGRVAAGEGEDGVGDVVGQHLALEQGPLGVELAELLLGDTVDS